MTTGRGMLVAALLALGCARAYAQAPPEGQGLDWQEDRWQQQEPRHALEPNPELLRPQLHVGVGAGTGSATVSAGDSDLRTGVNSAPRVELGYTHPFNRWFALAGTSHVIAWQSDLDEQIGYGDSFLVALSAVPEVRLVGQSALLYAGLALGPAIDVLATDERTDQFVEEADPALGLHYGARIGAQGYAGREFGIQFELALDGYLFEHSLSFHPRDGSPVRHEAVGHALSPIVSVSLGLVFPL